MKINTWDDMDKKYPMDRNNMTEEQHKEFVSDCFNLYEQEGFANVFWSSYDVLSGDCNAKKYIGKPFKVINRVTSEEVDLITLPMWSIQFEDGFETSAYPEEIILREMKNNGCKLI